VSGALVAVTFLVSHGIWNAGETAGFTKDKAAALIAGEIATPFEDADAMAEAYAAAKAEAAAEAAAKAEKAKADADAKAAAKAAAAAKAEADKA